jgi:alkylhydroperoxidase family enzyme
MFMPSRVPFADLPDETPVKNNLVRTTFNNPDLHRGFASLAGRVHMASHLSPAVREYAVLRTAAKLGATYQWANHVPVARDAGLTDKEIAALRDRDLDALTPEQARIARFAEAVEERTVDDALWAEMSAHYSPVELLDLTMLVAFYGLASRVTLALDVPLDPNPEGLVDP